MVTEGLGESSETINTIDLERLLVPAEVYVRQSNDSFDAIMGQT